MRFPLLFLCLAVAGCVTTKPGVTGTTGPDKARPPIIDPYYPITGKIALVNEQLRYVVVDFSLGRRPEPETRLNVYRAGQKVGEVKISNQSQDANVAADITAGTVSVGDTVREN